VVRHPQERSSLHSVEHLLDTCWFGWDFAYTWLLEMNDLSLENTRLVKYLCPLKNGVDTLYSMQGYKYHRNWSINSSEPYAIATHYLTVKAGLPADIAKPNKRVVTKIQRTLGKNGSTTIVETFLIVTQNHVSVEWYLVTNWPHEKCKDDWGRLAKDMFPHIKSGEVVYYVCKRPIPDKNYVLTPFRDSIYG
jgi:hypothetical protein